MIHRKIGKLEP